VAKVNARSDGKRLHKQVSFDGKSVYTNNTPPCYKHCSYVRLVSLRLAMVSYWLSIIINDAATVNDPKELLEGSMLKTIKWLSKAVSSLVLGWNLDDRDSATVHFLANVVKAYIHMLSARVSTWRLRK
jgi:hypothetical protein